VTDTHATLSPQAASSNTRSWQEHAERFCRAWQKGPGAIIESCCRLSEAKQEFPRDQFDSLIKLKLPIDPSVARKLLRIAANSILCAPGHTAKLPPCWTIIYDLSKLDDDVLLVGIADGRVHPGMQRKEARALRGQPLGKTPKKAMPVPSLVISWRASSDELKVGLFDTVGVAGFLKVVSLAFRRELETRLREEKHDGDPDYHLTAAFRLAMGHLKIMDDPATGKAAALSHEPEVLTALRGLARLHPDFTDLAVFVGEVKKEKRRRAA